jgi:hypothetical protein
MKSEILLVKITDAGRSVSVRDEKNDCTVRALALCLGLPYMEAYGKMAQLGRKKNTGFPLRFHSLDNLKGLFEIRPDLSCRTLGKVLPEIRSGRFIVRIYNHVFAVIDGEILDTVPLKTTERVKMVYQKI